MPDPVTPEEKRAYREGVVDQKLASHDAHFIEINGSIRDAAGALVDVEKAVGRIGDQLSGLVVSMPAIQTMVAETAAAAATAAKVAEALQDRRVERQTGWKSKREVAAWAVGIVISFATVTTLATRLLGIPAQAPQTQTVTVPR